MGLIEGWVEGCKDYTTKGKHRNAPTDNERKAPSLDDLHLYDNFGSRVL